MKNVLLVTSSPRGELSHSTQVATELAQSLGGSLAIRELWRDPMPPIGTDFIHAIFTPEADRTAQQIALLRPSDEAIEEIQRADVVVIAAGMINFGMPAALKTWIDQITRSGLTFGYGESGPEGLLLGKRVVLVLAAGGVYTTGPSAALDHLSPALRTNLEFLGMTDIQTVWIEGVGFGEEATGKALSQARQRSKELALTASAAA
jgi:FMN-dependent NADH-azoreductase